MPFRGWILNTPLNHLFKQKYLFVQVSKSIPFCIPDQPLRCIQSPVEHLRWSFFKKLLVSYIMFTEKSFNRWWEVSIILNNYTL